MLAIATSIALQLFVVYTPFMQPLFSTVALGFIEWIWIILMSLTVIAAVEVMKLVHKPSIS